MKKYSIWRLKSDGTLDFEVSEPFNTKSRANIFLKSHRRKYIGSKYIIKSIIEKSKIKRKSIFI